MSKAFRVLVGQPVAFQDAENSNASWRVGNESICIC